MSLLTEVATTAAKPQHQIGERAGSQPPGGAGDGDRLCRPQPQPVARPARRCRPDGSAAINGSDGRARCCPKGRRPHRQHRTPTRTPARVAAADPGVPDRLTGSGWPERPAARHGEDDRQQDERDDTCPASVLRQACRSAVLPRRCSGRPGCREQVETSSAKRQPCRCSTRARTAWPRPGPLTAGAPLAADRPGSGAGTAAARHRAAELRRSRSPAAVPGASTSRSAAGTTAADHGDRRPHRASGWPPTPPGRRPRRGTPAA